MVALLWWRWGKLTERKGVAARGELMVARVSSTIKQVQRRGVFFLPMSFTVFSCLSVLFSFSLSLSYFLFSVPCTFWWEGIYKGKAYATLPMCSHAEGVGWLGSHYTATLGPLARLVPFAPFIIIVGHKRGVGCVGFLGTWKREREREAL